MLLGLHTCNAVRALASLKAHLAALHSLPLVLMTAAWTAIHQPLVDLDLMVLLYII
jgi:hypothetical protein